VDGVATDSYDLDSNEELLELVCYDFRGFTFISGIAVSVDLLNANPSGHREATPFDSAIDMSLQATLCCPVEKLRNAFAKTQDGANVRPNGIS
jgi:hypothetical protein